MTKVRTPHSLEQALDRIAGAIGWVEMAVIADRQPSTVRNWSNPDVAESVPLNCALSLDLAYQKSGGVGAPIRDAYNFLLDREREAEFGCQIELLRTGADFSRELGEAQFAVMMASLPDASEAEYAQAEKEVADVLAPVAALTAILRRLRRKPP